MATKITKRINSIIIFLVFDSRLNELLAQAKEDDDARQAFIDLLEVLGSDNPKATEWRRKLASTLY